MTTSQAVLASRPRSAARRSSGVGRRRRARCRVGHRSPSCGRPPRDPPQEPARPDDQHDDEDRAVEDGLLDRGRQDACEDGRTEHDGHDRDRHEHHLGRARLVGGAGCGVGPLPSATVGLRRDPDRRDEHLARVRRAATSQEAGLGSMERDGQVGLDGRVPTARRWRGRWPSACRWRPRACRRPGPVDELDGAADGFAERAVHAGPEQRVDDDRCPGDPLAEYRHVAGDRQRGPWRSPRRGRSGPSCGRPSPRGPCLGRDDRHDDLRRRRGPVGAPRRTRRRRCCPGRTG